MPDNNAITPQKIFLGIVMFDDTFFGIKDIIIITRTKIIVTVIKVEDEVLLGMFPIVKSLPVIALYNLTGINSIAERINTIQLYFSFIRDLHCLI